MSVDIEEILGRELHDVAHGLHVPPMPALPEEAPRSHRVRHALLVAAVIILVVTVALTIEAIGGGSRELDPAPPVPTPGQSQTRVTIPTTAPTTPYVLDQQLYVDGTQVPGEWWTVYSGPQGWVAWSTAYTWSWGQGAEAHAIEGVDIAPELSPNGRYVGEVMVQDGQGTLTGFEIGPDGEGLSGVPIDIEQAEPVNVRAVTDDGMVIAQGGSTSIMWRPLVDGSTVNLSETAPRQQFLGNTPAGLVVTDGLGGTPYLADISASGVLTRKGDLPDLDSFAISPGAAWLAWTPEGSLGGEVTTLSSLQVQTLDGDEQLTLNAPSGWAFRVQDWTWEDDQLLVSPLLRADGSPGERLARCSVEAGRCVLIRSP
jgi:hypothetical protein